MEILTYPSAEKEGLFFKPAGGNGEDHRGGRCEDRERWWLSRSLRGCRKQWSAKFPLVNAVESCDAK